MFEVVVEARHHAHAVQCISEVQQYARGSGI
jgi:hypothetical protein